MKVDNLRKRLRHSGDPALIEVSKLGNVQIDKLLTALKSLDFNDRHRSSLYQEDLDGE